MLDPFDTPDHRRAWLELLLLALLLVSVGLLHGCAGQTPPQLDPCAAASALQLATCTAAPGSPSCLAATTARDAACGTVTPPVTPPPACTSTSCDPAETCSVLAGVISCAPPSPVCAPGASCGCWHRPPGQPWQPLPACAPEPPPTPPLAECPWTLPANCRRAFGDKAAGNGVDSTPQIECGDGAYCAAHGYTDGRRRCAVAGEGNPDRLACELAIFGGCPVWQFKGLDGAVISCVDDRRAAASCDHMGTQDHQDDPATPTGGATLATLQGFEGAPAICGLQRDEHGPAAGFWTVVHGRGWARPCPAKRADDSECGAWVEVDH